MSNYQNIAFLYSAMIKYLRYALAIFRAVLLVIPMGLFILSYLLLTKTIIKHTKERAFKLRRFYLRYCNFILGISTDVEGSLHRGVALFVSNHRSLSDPLILCQFLDAFVIAKAEVGQYPLISTGAELTGILYVKRENKDSRRAVREKMISTLENDNNVLVYPEGTVNYHKRTLPYRSGTFKEIARLNIPVVPICLEYRDAKDVWCNKPMLKHFLLQFGYLGTRTKMVIGEPIQHPDGEQLCKMVEKWTNDTIDEIHASWDSYFNKHDAIQE